MHKRQTQSGIFGGISSSSLLQRADLCGTQLILSKPDVRTIENICFSVILIKFKNALLIPEGNLILLLLILDNFPHRLVNSSRC